MTGKELALAICKAISEKKGRDIVIIDVEKKTTLCSYFVIASGSSSTQVKALAENVDEQLEKNFNLAPTRHEGISEGRWAVLDYGDVIVHIFNDDSRLFYNLERLWENGDNFEKYVD